MFKLNIHHFLRALLLLSLFFSNYSKGFAQDARLIAKRVFPSVVMLDMRDDKNRPISLGSGFFVRPDVIVTNHHVIKGAANGFAKIVGKTTIFHIEGVVGIDKVNDLALLKLTGVSGKPLILADISKIEVGQEVFAFGSPKGLEGTVSPGIISGNSFREIENGNLIQITAPISSGSSGGPVVDKKGEVIGVAVASLKDGQNLNFAIPSSYLALLLADVKSIVPLTDVALLSPEKKSSHSEPSFLETSLWLTSKLEGGHYLVPATAASDEALVTLKMLRFSGCQIILEKTDSMRSVSSRIRSEVSIVWITTLRAGLNNLGFPSVQIDFNRELVHRLTFSDGTERFQKSNFVLIPVADVETGERAVKAFNRLKSICKNDMKTEPF